MTQVVGYIGTAFFVSIFWIIVSSLKSFKDESRRLKLLDELFDVRYEYNNLARRYNMLVSSLNSGPSPAVVAAYKTFGLKVGASAQEVKRQFRILMLQYHPDHNKAVNANAKFQTIHAAHAVIKKYLNIA